MVSSIWLPRRVQPSSVVALDKSALTHKLVVAWMPHTGDIVGRANFSISGASSIRSSYGNIGAGNFASVSDVVSAPDLSGKVGNIWTVAYVLRTNGSDTNGFGKTTNGVSAEHYPYSGGIYITAGSNARHSISVPAGVNLRVPHCIVLSIYSPGESNTGFGAIAGIKFSGLVPIGSANAFTPTSPNLGYSPAYAGFDGEFYAMFLWDRLLSVEEGVAVSRNPWQLFSPRRVWIEDAPTFSVPSISAVYADSVTASSVVPRVSLTF